MKAGVGCCGSPIDSAFFNERRGEVYDAACANQAWERMMAFLGKTVG
jgi:dienelactone hydrolase